MGGTSVRGNNSQHPGHEAQGQQFDCHIGRSIESNLSRIGVMVVSGNSALTPLGLSGPQGTLAFFASNSRGTGSIWVTRPIGEGFVGAILLVALVSGVYCRVLENDTFTVIFVNCL
jgi:hypothetical protein